MKAITTRYIGATDRKPARILATDQDGNRITLPADGDFPYTTVHQAAAVALCQRMSWPGADTLRGGTIKHGMVWVFTGLDLDEAARRPREARDRDGYLGQLTAAADRCPEAEKIDSLDEGPPVSYPCQLPAGHEGAHRHGRRMWS